MRVEQNAIEGVTQGLDPFGFLIVRQDNGERDDGSCRRCPAMLLALDVGNTNVTIGAFDGQKLAGRWRLRTIREQTADEWGILIRNLFSLSGLDLAAVDGVIISSVVPAVDQPLEAMADRYFLRKPLFVNYRDRSGYYRPI